MIAARRGLSLLREDRFLTGAGDPPDVAWHRADGAADDSGGLERAGGRALVVVFAAEGGRGACRDRPAAGRRTT